MGDKREPITFNGRSIGIAILTAEQLFIGVVHFLVGLLLLFPANNSAASLVYDIYTLFLACSFQFLHGLFGRAKKQVG